ncbi:retrovirus-related pol polyprotein from transposon TNT 1-94 [Tanacetum coccineum]
MRKSCHKKTAVPDTDTMADMNIPANDAPAEQAPGIAPSTKTDDQILPLRKWVPIGKSNCVLDLDEQWFNLYKDFLRDALDYTPTNDNNPFMAPPSSDTIIEYVNTMGYPILWGVIHHSNIDYAERIWEEFVQSIQTFLTDRKNLTTASRGKKKTAHLIILSVRFVRKDGREIFGMLIPDALLTDDIKGAPYYYEYLEADLQRALELSLKDQGEQTQGPARPVVIRETKSGRIQLLPDVQGKGKEKVIDEQAAHDLLTLHTPKQKNANLALTDNETESNKEAPEIHAGDQDEGQAGPNPGEQDEGQAGPNLVEQDEGRAGSNPSDAAESQS